VFYRHLQFRDCFNHGTERSWYRPGFDDGFQLSTFRKNNPSYTPRAHVRIISKLMDSSCPLRTHVRHLQIGPFRHRELHRGVWQSHYTQDMTLLPDIGISTQDIIDILHVLSNLQDFSWHACCHIPSGILEAIHSRWPRARLHINLPHRKERDWRRNRLDKQALSSPQLHSLDLAFHYAQNPVPGRESQPCELPQLMEMISGCKKLKNLNLRPIDIDDMEELQPELDIRLPSLERLTIPENCNTYDMGPCLWSTTMNWSSLRHLKIHRPMTDHVLLFRALTGRVSGLRCLVLALQPPLDDAGVFESFIYAVNKLESFAWESWVVDASPQKVFSGFWPTILNHHRNSLRNVKVDCNFQYDATIWKEIFLQPLLLTASRIEDLEFAVVVGVVDVDGRIENDLVWVRTSDNSCDLHLSIFQSHSRLISSILLPLSVITTTPALTLTFLNVVLLYR
jgi:hypothetical protein